MDGPSRRTTRRAAGLAAALATLAVGAGSAVAGPTLDAGAAWTGTSDQAGAGRIFAEPNAIYGAFGAQLQVGDRHGHRYCNQFGPGTQIVGALVKRIRWNTQSVGAYMRLLTPGGELGRRLNDQMVVGQHYDEWFTFPGGQCFDSELFSNGTTLLGTAWRPTYTDQLMNVRVEDVQGPAVSAPGVPTGWVTDASLPVSWSSSDNGLFRAGTGAFAIGGGSADLGDPGDGPIAAGVPVGALADGPQTACSYRDGVGWARAQACVGFRLDRTPPAAPAIALSPDAAGGWSNTPVTVTTAATADGTGSGWSRNQFEVNGGGWADSPAVFVRSEEGTATLAARAVDGAGLVSATSAPRVVRIDRTPPVAQLSVAAAPAPGLVTLSRGQTADALSGLRSWSVRLGGADGPLVADTAAGLAAVGQSAPAANAGTVRFTLVATDNAGNTASATTAPVRLDAVAPTPQLLEVPSGWVRDFAATPAGDTRLRVALADNLPDGVGMVDVQARQDAGPWITIAAFNRPGSPSLGQGTHLLGPSLAGSGLADGPAELRVVAHDPTFPALEGATPAQGVRLDLTSPEAGDPGAWSAAPAGTPGMVQVSLPTLVDRTSGLASVEVMVNTDPSGGAAQSGFVRGGLAAGLAGTPRATLDLASFAEGVHATQVRATDLAGNVLVMPGPPVSLDRLPPVIAGLAVDADTGLVTFGLADGVGLGACPATIELLGPGTGGAFQQVFAQAAGSLGPKVAWPLPMGGMAPGDYQVRVTVCDAAGNRASQIARFAWAPPRPVPAAASAASAAGGPPGPSLVAPAGAANAVVAVDVHATSQVATRLVRGVLVPVVRTRYGRVVRLTGRLQRPDGTPWAGVGIELRDTAGRHLAGGRTDGGGRFALRARAGFGGVWTLSVVGAPGAQPAAVLEVTPIVTARTRIARTRTAQRLTVSGRLQPAAGAFGKAVQLQWRDARGRWRPLANGLVARNGRFAIRYVFRRPGPYTVKVRVSVPREIGWPFLATATRPVTLRVR
jgi:Bacterial Ig-like domain